MGWVHFRLLSKALYNEERMMVVDVFETTMVEKAGCILGK